MYNGTTHKDNLYYEHHTNYPHKEQIPCPQNFCSLVLSILQAEDTLPELLIPPLYTSPSTLLPTCDDLWRVLCVRHLSFVLSVPGMPSQLYAEWWGGSCPQQHQARPGHSMRTITEKPASFTVYDSNTYVS